MSKDRMLFVLQIANSMACLLWICLWMLLFKRDPSISFSLKAYREAVMPALFVMTTFVVVASIIILFAARAEGKVGALVPLALSLAWLGYMLNFFAFVMA
jgi:hypothetical protein